MIVFPMPDEYCSEALVTFDNNITYIDEMLQV